jgi:hypothetical protein
VGIKVGCNDDHSTCYEDHDDDDDDNLLVEAYSSVILGG